MNVKSNVILLLTYHLQSNVCACLHVELSSALLEKIFETLAEQIHDHNVIHLAVLSFLIAYEMQEWHKSLSSQLVNQLALPEQHDMSLHLDSFLLQAQIEALSKSNRISCQVQINQLISIEYCQKSGQKVCSYL